MKLETKLGIYAIITIVLTIIGLSVMLYPFEFYSLIDTKNFSTLSIVFGIKGVGVIMLYISSEIYSKHFKKEI